MHFDTPSFQAHHLMHQKWTMRKLPLNSRSCRIPKSLFTGPRLEFKTQNVEATGQAAISDAHLRLTTDLIFIHQHDASRESSKMEGPFIIEEWIYINDA